MCLHMLQNWLGTTSVFPTKPEGSRRKLLSVYTSPGLVLQHFKTQCRALAPCYTQTLLTSQHHSGTGAKEGEGMRREDTGAEASFAM